MAFDKSGISGIGDKFVLPVSAKLPALKPGEVVRATVLGESGSGEIAVRVKGRVFAARSEIALAKDTAVLFQVETGQEPGASGQLRLRFLGYADAPPQAQGEPQAPAQAAVGGGVRELANALAGLVSVSGEKAEVYLDALHQLLKQLPLDIEQLPKDTRTELRNLLEATIKSADQSIQKRITELLAKPLGEGAGTDPPLLNLDRLTASGTARRSAAFNEFRDLLQTAIKSADQSVQKRFTELLARFVGEGAGTDPTSLKPDHPDTAGPDRQPAALNELRNLLQSNIKFADQSVQKRFTELLARFLGEGAETDPALLIPDRPGTTGTDRQAAAFNELRSLMETTFRSADQGVLNRITELLAKPPGEEAGTDPTLLTPGRLATAGPDRPSTALNQLLTLLDTAMKPADQSVQSRFTELLARFLGEEAGANPALLTPDRLALAGPDRQSAALDKLRILLDSVIKPADPHVQERVTELLARLLGEEAGSDPTLLNLDRLAAAGPDRQLAAFLEDALSNTGVALESKMRVLQGEESLTRDLKAYLLQVKEFLSEPGRENHPLRPVLPTVHELLSSIETLQALSKTTDSFYTFLPVVWQELGHALISFKKGGRKGSPGDSSYYCMINLDLDTCGSLMILALMEGRELYLSLEAENSKFQKLLNANMPELGNMLRAAGLKVKMLSVNDGKHSPLQHLKELDPLEGTLDIRV